MKSYDIFISYRRVGGADKARTIKAELELQGFHVFLDFDELKDGVFDQRIIHAIESAPIFMMILTPHALDRCMDEQDWVRREIEYAIAQQKHVVPIDADRSFDGFDAQLPTSIKEGLGLHQFSEVMFGQLFKESVAKMIRDRIRPVLEQNADGSTAVPSGVGALIHLETDVDCRIYRFGKEVTVALKGEDTVIRLTRGKHKLEFVSLQNEADRLSMLYPVPENDFEDLLTIELLAVQQKREAEEREAAKRVEKARLAQEKAEREAAAKAEAARLAEIEEKEREARHKANMERLANIKADEQCRFGGKGRDGIYKVGDYYDDGVKRGVVFEVSQDGRHGKILSLVQTCLPWAAGKNFGSLFHRDTPTKQFHGLVDVQNGMNNQMAIAQIANWQEKYPAFAWCANLGTGWYLPAIEELKLFTTNDRVHEAVNCTLYAKGGTPLDKKGTFSWNWSSTEENKQFNSQFCAWYVLMSLGGPNYGPKRQDGSVRAVSAF